MNSFYSFLDDLLDKTVVLGYDRIGYGVRRNLWDPAETNVDMTGRVCVITGANSGLGRAAAAGLASRGATVVMVCRNPERGEEARAEIEKSTGNSNLVLEIADMSNRPEVRDLAERINNEYDRLDVLVNNAGLLINERTESPEGIEMTFAINTLGYFALTNLLTPLLISTAKAHGDARVVNVSSGGMYFVDLGLDDLQYEKRDYDGVRAYAHSKRQEVVMSDLWAKQLRKSGVFVASMHPGWADTKGVQNSLPVFRAVTKAVLRSAEEGADTIIWLAINPKLTLEDSGRFWLDRKARPEHRMNSTKNTDAEIKKFWNICVEMTGTGKRLDGETVHGATVKQVNGETGER